MSKPRICLVADTRNWAFHNTITQISPFLQEKFNITVVFNSDFSSRLDLFQYMYCEKKFDLCHILGAEANGMGELLLVDKTLSIDRKQQFSMNFIKTVLTGSIHSHLNLEKKQFQLYAPSFIHLYHRYFTKSEILKKIYTCISYIPDPWGSIHNGVSPDIFYPPQSTLYNSTKLVAGWSGNSRWAEEKGFDLKGLHSIIKPAIQDMLHHGSAIELRLADGDSFEKVQAETPTSSLDQRGRPKLSLSLMRDFYHKIDVVVCMGLMEATPNPVLEGMACGRAIISNCIGNVPEVFGPKQREFMIPRSRYALRKALQKLVDNPNLVRELGEENLESIASWTREAEAAEWAKFFEDALATGRTPESIARRQLLLDSGCTYEMLVQNMGKRLEEMHRIEYEAEKQQTDTLRDVALLESCLAPVRDTPQLAKAPLDDSQKGVLLTVLMPVFNCVKYLNKAVASVLSQDMPHFELWLIDDGSTDGTEVLCDRWKERDSRVVVHHQSNMGLSATLAYWTEQITTPYMARMDGDDILLDQVFSRQIEYIKAHPDSAAVGGGYIIFDQYGERNQPYFSPSWEKKPWVKCVQNPIPHVASMFNMAALRKVGGYRPLFEHAEDYDFYLRLAEEGILESLPYVLHRRRVHEEAVTTRHAEEQVLSATLAWCSHAARQLDEDDPAERFAKLPDYDTLLPLIEHAGVEAWLCYFVRGRGAGLFTTQPERMNNIAQRLLHMDIPVLLLEYFVDVLVACPDLDEVFDGGDYTSIASAPPNLLNKILTHLALYGDTPAFQTICQYYARSAMTLSPVHRRRPPDSIEEQRLWRPAMPLVADYANIFSRNPVKLQRNYLPENLAPEYLTQLTKELAKHKAWESIVPVLELMLEHPEDEDSLTSLMCEILPGLPADSYSEFLEIIPPTILLAATIQILEKKNYALAITLAEYLYSCHLQGEQTIDAVAALVQIDSSNFDSLRHCKFWIPPMLYVQLARIAPADTDKAVAIWYELQSIAPKSWLLEDGLHDICRSCDNNDSSLLSILYTVMPDRYMCRTAFNVACTESLPVSLCAILGYADAAFDENWLDYTAFQVLKRLPAKYAKHLAQLPNHAEKINNLINHFSDIRLSQSALILQKKVLCKTRVIVKIEGLNTSNLESKGTEVWIQKIGNLSDMNIFLHQTGHNYIDRSPSLVFTRDNSFLWSGEISEHICTINRQSYSGVVKVTVNNVQKVFDLYRPSGQEQPLILSLCDFNTAMNA